MKSLSRLSAVILIVVVMLSLFGWKAWSYVRAGWSSLESQVEEAAPLKIKVERAKAEVAALNDEIPKNLVVLGRQQTALTRLEATLAGDEAKLATSRAQILRLSGDLRTNKAAFQYGGRQFERKEVEKDLARRLDEFKRRETHVDKLRGMVAATRERFQVARNRVDDMLHQKEDMQVSINDLMVRVELLDVAKATSNLHFDDSRSATRLSARKSPNA